MNLQHTPPSILGALTLLAFIPLWFHFAVPWLTRLPSDFQYHADITSYDNFYNEQKSDYEGEKRSVTKFAYEVMSEKQNVFVIRNAFDVRTVTGDKIFSVERLYEVDSYTGKHVPGAGDHDRSGFLFAPRHLRKGEPYTYWHVNYDGPAHLTFAGEENISGLRVYRYETRYEGVTIDQTKNLEFLPGVGVTRGVQLEPYLQVWVEPVSGYMVKYKDDTLAYFYDLKTGEQLNPWNHFSNSYTLESVLQQVKIANKEKVRLILIEDVLPALLALIAAVVILVAFRKHHASKLLLVCIIAAAVCIVAGTWATTKKAVPASYTGPIEKIRLGAEKGLLASSIWIAEHNGYFQKQGLDVEVREFPSGRAALTSMLTDGNLNMATVAQTPVVLHSFSRDDFAIIARMVGSDNDNKILARKDRNIHAPLDIQGKIIGVTKGSTGHYFLSLFLAQIGLELSDVTIVDLEASALPTAIVNGQVDAIASWEPHIFDAKNILGDSASLFESRGTFREDFYFSVLKNWARSNPVPLQRFLLAIDEANTFLAEHPKESQKIVAERLQLDSSFVESVWKDYSFVLFLDQPILLTFEQQARWMLANAITDKTAPSNYLNFIYFDALEAVKPASITILR